MLHSPCKNVPDGQKTRFWRFLYTIHFAYLIQCYFFTIFFILFVFNTLHTLLYYNILTFNILYCFVCLFARLFAQKYQFSPLF